MSAGRFSGFPVSMFFGNQSGSAVNLAQMESYGFSPNSNVSFLTPAGSVDRLHSGLANAVPSHRFGTRDLDTILTNIPDMATGIVSDSTDVNIPSAVFRYQERQCNGVFSSGTQYANVAAKGYILPMSIGASEDDTDGALASLQYMSLSLDGLTAPDVKLSDESTRPAPAFSSRFFHGPTFYNSALIKAIDGATVNFGINLTTSLFSCVYPQCYTVQTRTPSITLTGTQVALDAGLSKFINSISGAWVQYFRKGINNSSRVPDSLGQHVSATVTSGKWCIDDESWQGTEDGKISVDIQAVGGVVAISRNVVIPTP